MDWTDQAFLLTHLERVNRGELNQLRQADQPAVAGQAPLSGAHARLNLRRVGIRTATDLLKAFSVEQEGGKRVFRVPDGLQPPLPSDQLRLVVTVLAAEPGLAPVWNWQRNGVPECRAGAGPKAA